jgi:hypothetical protein
MDAMIVLKSVLMNCDVIFIYMGQKFQWQADVNTVRVKFEGKEFIDQLSDYQLTNKDCGSVSLFLIRILFMS